MNEVIYTDSKGNTKYYASYKTAWMAAARLNAKDSENFWVFEADTNGWYVFHDANVGA
jgi:hypothetical protein